MHYERVEWFPDGQRVLFSGNEPNHPPRTFVQDLKGGPPSAVTAEGRTAAAVSPDQKMAAMTAGGKLSLVPIGGGEPKALADIEPDESVMRWSADGKSLYLRKSDGLSSLKIIRLNVAAARKEVWKELKPPDPVGVQIGQVVMTPDGTAYAYSYQRDISTLYLANGLK